MNYLEKHRCEIFKKYDNEHTHSRQWQYQDRLVVDRRTRSSSDDLQDAGHQSDSHAGCRSTSDTEVGTHLAGITTGSIFLWQRCNRGDEAPDELSLAAGFSWSQGRGRGGYDRSGKSAFRTSAGNGMHSGHWCQQLSL